MIAASLYSDDNFSGAWRNLARPSPVVGRTQAFSGKFPHPRSEENAQF
jgi:hypothetical protein